jgi:integrase
MFAGLRRGELLGLLWHDVNFDGGVIRVERGWDMYAGAIAAKSTAGAIEYGHAEIDLKKTMQGKIVPFFASKSATATGPYAARGLDQIGKSNQYTSKSLNNKLQALGKANMNFTKHAGKGPTGGAGAYYISFRRVGKTGWIIPAAKPRPFMRRRSRSRRRTPTTSWVTRSRRSSRPAGAAPSSRPPNRKSA